MSTSNHNQPDIQPRTADSPRRAILVALGLLFAAAIPPLAIVEGFKLVQAQFGYGGDLAFTYIGGGLLATIAIGLIGVAYHRIRPVTVHVPRWLPTVRESGWIVAGIVISLVAAILIEIGMQLVNAIPPTNFITAAAAERPVLVYGFALLGVLFIVGPIEEYFFRGIVQGRLREQMGPVPAIAIVSVGFTLGHVPSYWIGGSDLLSLGVFFALLSIAVGSVILGAIYERTQNLVVVIAIHSLINAIGVSLALVAALGA
ncbi:MULTISPECIES: CPBP family intramembrane glutamic endopeptidase [unclassified Halorubrum]|uniref:CPBP family intramembrane glutamic endopeptidase n=1 Tax=unclassified Halorubrum TaxID=2642239 RepID=UPI0011402AFC|nr:MULTISPECIES: type II CAAX endopeptidase family protein [unclassified Halorubrum]